MAAWASKRRSRLGGVSELKPAYLISGDDESRIDAWRRRVRARAESEGPSATLEVLRDDRLTGEAFAASLASLTLSMGGRYVLADGVDRWRERDLKPAVAALENIPQETVVVLIAPGKAPAALAKAVKKAGGVVHDYKPPTAATYPAWAVDQAREMGFALTREGSQALVERVGRDDKNRVRQQRLMRELEKLAVFARAGEQVDTDVVDELTASTVDSRAYEIADALIAGDGARALLIAEEMRSGDVDIMHILFAVLRQLRQSRRAWAIVASGGSVADVASALRLPDWLARKIAAQVRRADPERIERALDLLADLDFAVRGGGRLDADSSLTLALAGAAARVPGESS